MSDLLLPKDIQVEIFLKLPLNSILTCKCVCKPWRQLLCSREFVKNHLNRSIQENGKIIVSLNHQFYLSKVYSLDYASISEASSSQSFPWDGSGEIDFPSPDNKRFDCVEILGSCGGLICLHMSSASLKYENTAIWNPSTREYKNVRVLGFKFRAARHAITYGFGYDHVKDDYKLVRIHNNEDFSRNEIHVYRLGSDKWCRAGTSQTLRQYYFLNQRKSDGLFFNGALHWFGVIQVNSTEVIVSFDVSNERIVDIPLPVVLNLKPYRELGESRTLGVLEDCLCLVFVDGRGGTDVWVMKDYGLKESWTKQFTITQDAVTSFDSSSFWKPILVYKNGDILADAAWKSVVCDPKEGSIREVCNFLGRSVKMDLVSYVESLVSLNSGTYAERKIQHTNTPPKKSKKF